MKRAIALFVAPLSAATILAACGGGDDTADTTDIAPSDAQVVEVSMTDMAFTPADLDVEAGETVTFVFRNDGAVRHEAVVGDLAAQEAHHAEMAAAGGAHDDMDMGSMAPEDMESMPHEEMTEMHSVVVEPGQTVEMTHTFDRPGPTMVGCHEPGHWEAGMSMQIDV